MREIIINKTNEKQRLDKYLKRILPSASNSFIYKMLRKKNIELNCKRAKGDEILKAGDSIKFFLSDDTFTKMSSIKENVSVDYYLNAYKTLKGIEIIFEHEDFLIANKPAGILTQKNDNNDLSLNEWCIGYLFDRHIIDEKSFMEFKPSVLNRLDRNTKGLVLFGKTLKGSQRLSQMIQKRDIKKYYLAKTGPDCNLDGVYIAYHHKDSKTNKVEIFKNEKDIPDNLKYTKIETGVKVIETNKDYSLLEIDLLTGKSHQIRAHLSYLGFPLLGDKKYNGKSDSGNKYQNLCAHKIVFPEFSNDDEWHSLSGKIVKC